MVSWQVHLFFPHKRSEGAVSAQRTSLKPLFETSTLDCKNCITCHKSYRREQEAATDALVVSIFRRQAY
jgi:hypothetical protein